MLALGSGIVAIHLVLWMLSKARLKFFSAYCFLLGAIALYGTLAALTYRVATYGVAAVGAVYYIASRKRIDEALHDASELADAGEVDPTSSELM